MENTGEKITRVLSTAYWPNLYYFMHVLTADTIVIDAFEHYEKQSYRNRCSILSANGVLDLSIPVQHPGKAGIVKDTKITDGKWRTQHQSAIQSAYGKAPYFAFFGEEVLAFYEKPYTSLLEFNTAQLQFVLKVLRLKKVFSISESYVDINSEQDLRKTIHPKKIISEDAIFSQQLQKPYYQGFSDRFGFSGNLSVLDILFNKGLESLPYLHCKL